MSSNRRPRTQPAQPAPTAGAGTTTVPTVSDATLSTEPASAEDPEVPPADATLSPELPADAALEAHVELAYAAAADLEAFIAGRYVAPQRLELAQARHLRAVLDAGERVDVDWYTQRVLFPTLGLG